MKTAGGMSACCWMLLKVTVSPAATGFGDDAVAVMVMGIRLDCVGIRLLTQALSKVAALAGLAGSKKTLATTAKAASTAIRRRLIIASPLLAIPFALSLDSPDPFRSSEAL